MSHKALASSMLERARGFLQDSLERYQELVDIYLLYGKSLLALHDSESKAESVNYVEQAYGICSECKSKSEEQTMMCQKLTILRYIAAGPLQNGNFEGVLKCVSVPPWIIVARRSWPSIKALIGLSRYEEAEEELVALISYEKAAVEPLFEAAMHYLPAEEETTMRAKALRALCLCYSGLVQYDRAAEHVDAAEKLAVGAEKRGTLMSWRIWTEAGRALSVTGCKRLREEMEMKLMAGTTLVVDTQEWLSLLRRILSGCKALGAGLPAADLVRQRKLLCAVDMEMSARSSWIFRKKLPYSTKACRFADARQSFDQVHELMRETCVKTFSMCLNGYHLSRLWTGKFSIQAASSSVLKAVESMTYGKELSGRQFIRPSAAI
ncbi:hypothetical protein SELMODRAFT_418970 [Selaginella moellendorffii]|uniref:Protein ZIP4 homolog n=1 Tax=Selaginella moellendorffii TaxID=88036 RepID=D8S7E1_SELML|nr:hypothetical protein SELMODRAFT_418970 [Selaginella moellendorffii]